MPKTKLSQPQKRRKRIPKLAYTKLRGIGWHVSYRDPQTGLPKKHRFGDVTEDKATAMYHQWIADKLTGKKPAPAQATELQKLKAPTKSAEMVTRKSVPGSLLHVASDLLRFDEERTRAEGGPRVRGSIHPRVRLNRRKMLLDFMEFMNERHGQGSMGHMKLADLSIADVEAYNRKIALASYSQSQVTERLQMVHAVIERAGRPEFGHQVLQWNWSSRDVIHGVPAEKMKLPTLDQLQKLLKASELREQSMIWLGIGLGFGPSDLAALRVGQIDEASYDLRRGKTGIERFGDTPPLVWGLVSKYIAKERRPKGELMFVTRTGRPIVHGRTNSVFLWWDKLRKEIGESSKSIAGFYVLRHLGATEYGSRSGISVGEVKRWLGHSATSRIADVYMKPVAPEQKPVVEWVRTSLAIDSIR